MSTQRDQALAAISEISLNGYVTRKLDFLGTVHIYGAHYFNVFRRYNSVYEIVLEDMHGDFHFHKDYTVRQSLQSVLCLSDEQMKTIHVRYATSFKHGSYPTGGAEAVNMRWSQIHAQWQGVALDVGGILEDYHRESQIKDEIKDDSENLVVQGTPCVLHPAEDSPQHEPQYASPIASPIASVAAVPDAPPRPLRQVNVVLENGQGDVLLHFQTAQSLSDRFAEVENKKRTWTQLSESEDESEDEEQTPEYLVLRNGTRVQRN